MYLHAFRANVENLQALISTVREVGFSFRTSILFVGIYRNICLATLCNTYVFVYFADIDVSVHIKLKIWSSVIEYDIEIYRVLVETE